ncbi:hypothetical protein GV828_04925 [Flavobacterium sp. NST-5]|uniref:Uncharacterized protein n=1 Tax=Flavobacterium ichthyis TaxID=2698827 RepID=A0ABW9ZB53_9FLAO|nr:hypothetical protein [Flavobacterium ichthyis]NBL64542.1 hypothetical protein [Flavobacterium ichthyis]
MKSLSILFFLIFFQISNAQNIVVSEKERAEKQFEIDVKNNHLKIYVQGGIVSAIKKEDVDFAEKHGFYYHEFGCLAPANRDYYEHYNQLVFIHLTQKFGTEWKSQVSESSIGFKV